MPPTIRAINAQASDAGSYTVTWPSGTVVGDLVVIIGASAFPWVLPPGWAGGSYTGSNNYLSGMVVSKVITSADISSGGIVLNPGGTYHGAVMTVAFVGSGNLVEVSWAYNGGTLSQSVTTSNSASISDLLLYFGSQRDVTGMCSVNRGTLQSTATDNSGIVACLYSEVPGSSGDVTAVFNYADGTKNSWSAIIKVTDTNLLVSKAQAYTTLSVPGLSVSKAQAYDIPGPYGLSVSKAQAYAVSWATLILTPPSIPSGQFNQPYTQNVNASGGTSPYTFTLGAGYLPAGITLSSAGVISGTPTASGNFPFTVTATDVNGIYGSINYNLYITAPPPPITVSPAAVPPGTVGETYSQQFSASGGTGPYAFTITSGTVPVGLSFSVEGLLSGTPQLTGSSSFTVTATDSNNLTGSSNYAIVVSAAPVITPPPTGPSGNQPIQFLPASYYANLFTHEYKVLPMFVFEWFIDVINIAQDISVCLASITAAFDLDTAIGVQLDVLGTLVGTSRNVPFQPTGGVSPILDDPTFRLLIRATIANNQWDGTQGSLYPIWKSLFPNGSIIIIDNQNMTADITMTGSFSSIIQDMITHGMIVPRPQAVAYNYIFGDLPFFGFGFNNEFIAGFGLGHWG